MELSSLTPMMQQFFTLKEQNPGFLLFFRMGDFYEMFDEDARIGSKILGLTLTKRQQFDMCGIPHHAKDNYLHKLIEAKLKVAICEQVEVSIGEKRLFDRKITELLTPGTFHGDKLAQKSENSFLMSLFFCQKIYYFALADVNTGDLFLGEAKTKEHVASEIYRIRPAEILVPTSQSEILNPFLKETYHSLLPDRWFVHPEKEFLQFQFHIQTLSSIGLATSPAQGVIFATLQYLRQNLFKEIVHLNTIRKLSSQSSLWLSETTIQNLELLPKTQREEAKYSLYAHLNQTKTSVGARYLRHLIASPSIDKKEIQNRLDKVQYFIQEQSMREPLRKILDSLPDFQRLISKLSLKTANPKDIWAFKVGLDRIQTLWELLSGSLLEDFIPASVYNHLEQMSEYLSSSLIENPPLSIEGEAIFQEGFSSDLAHLRKQSTQSYQLLLDIEERERTQNNLPRLRVKYNKILGYYMELPKMEAQKAPSYFIRKQSLSNLERFTIEELINFETLVLSSKAKLVELEKELFMIFCGKILDWLPALQTLISGICEIDIITTFAHISAHSQYTRPEILEEGKLEIHEGRHPVVEHYTSFFTPNSLLLDQEENRLWIISGPNMAGKSTFLRQCAIIVLMAHMGCFVPASSAKIPITDQIFTRIGSSDNLAKGESTFLVEMSEASTILNFSTSRSLIIMDELGRGTSTNDGLALCWSIIEYLCHPTISRGRTLFSTHYHELAFLEQSLKGVKNYQMSVEETETGIVFLHKIEHGAATRSYGIHVASLAGLPNSVIQRAQAILASLNENTAFHEKVQDLDKSLPTAPSENLSTSPILKELQSLALDKITGINALLLLQKWQKISRKNSFSKEEGDSILF